MPADSRSIQELERERDDMMSAIEAQLAQAVSGLQSSVWADGFRPGSPSTIGGEPSSPRTFRGISRPGTANTVPSIMMMESGPAMSVLGAAGARAQERISASTCAKANCDVSREKSMADRVATIQL